MASDSTAIKEAVITIKVFGIGGGGNSVLKRIAESGITGVELVAVNTDAKQLSTLSALKVKTVQIGEALTKGRGTGGNPAIGMHAAEREEEKLRSMMRGADLIFVTAAMGGGTGTGATPEVARIARDLGILTVGVVTMPFGFEGRRKMRIAQEAVVQMRAYMDPLIVVRNDNLMKLSDDRKMSFVGAFHAADEVLKQAIDCVAEMILTTGVVNVDFADVATIFRQGANCDAILGMGQSKISAVAAVQQAVESPLIERSLEGARGMILNITGDDSLTLYDVSEATKYIYKQTGDDVNIIFGTVIDNKMDGVIQATIIATDFPDRSGTNPHTGAMPQMRPSMSTVQQMPQSQPQTQQGPVGKPASNGDFTLEAPSFMNKRNNEEVSGGAFAIPAFKLTRDDSAPEGK